MLCTCGTCGGSGSAVLLAGLKGYGSHWELGQLLLGKRNRIRGGGIVRTCRGGFAVVLQGFVLLAQFFVGLAHHALDERIALVRLLKLLQCRFVISCIERSAPTPTPHSPRPATTDTRCWSTSSGLSTIKSSGRPPLPALSC